PAIDFLRDMNLGMETPLGDRVAVIGGGNVAMDAVRSAVRKGSGKPFIIYRRSLEEMPANEEEIEECKEEGIDILFLTNPTRIIGENGRVKAVECIRMELGAPDSDGRRRPEPVPGSEFIIEVDTVIPAIGQETDWACLTPECACQLSEWGTMHVDSLTLQSDDPDIFAGGDAVTGPRTVIEAVARGKDAAISIDRFLQGQDLREGREKDWHAVEDVPTEGYDLIPRARMPRQDPHSRRHNFDQVELGFSEEQARKEAERCLSCGVCSECYQCSEVCLAKAIKHEDQPRELKIPVGAVILASGFESAVISQAGEFGHGRYPNVVTNLEYERMLSASGPYGGHPERPSDGRKPKKIAWIQCVGSRDSNHNRNFCSSVCCMAAVKQAIITCDHDKESDASIFYIDMRAHGKDFDRYVLRAENNYGVKFIPSMISIITQNPLNKNLAIEYCDRNTLEQTREEFDLVVLSVGMKPSRNIDSLTRKLDIEQNEYGFAMPNSISPTGTCREGIFVCGSWAGPKDIPESVTEASAAAASAAVVLAEYREEENSGQAESVLRDVSGEAPRIGVFVCHCGRNIAGVLNVNELREFAADLPNVEVAEDFLFTCSTQTQDRIKELIKEKGLNRVVVSACSPRSHEPLFQETLQEAGLNKYLFEMANIRDQCAWVHGGEPDAATDKARQLISGAVSRAAMLEPIRESVTEVAHRGLVIGGGLAGMTAALSLADQGIPTTLVEKDADLGGMARDIYYTLEGHSPRDLTDNLISRVKTHRNISLFTGAAVRKVTGGPGHFVGIIKQNGTEISGDFGAVIIATGGEPYRPTEYFYGQHPLVVTQLELEKRIFTGQGPIPDTTVMIQCVGSRTDDFPLCSRVCCSAAVKNAIQLRKKNPKSSVYILYRDIRTFGFKEEYYKQARDLGVMFLRFDPGSPPDVRLEEGVLTVKAFDAASQMDIEINPDLLVLSNGIRPRPEAAEVAKMLKLPRMQEGFFMEAHPKLSPLDFGSAGFFLCGLAHSPRFMEETLAQAKGAACRAAGLLLQKEILTSAIVAQVDPERCAACLICVYSCPYNVPRINEDNVSVIDPRSCHGCGTCVSECPAKAITLKHFTDGQILTHTHAVVG
ncbi:MAG: FAD-dependent oxidoreductase, partial [Syntrophobacteraceae bacterium]